jgi:hypothetical protein
MVRSSEAPTGAVDDALRFAVDFDAIGRPQRPPAANYFKASAGRLLLPSLRPREKTAGPVAHGGVVMLAERSVFARIADDLESDFHAVARESQLPPGAIGVFGFSWLGEGRGKPALAPRRFGRGLRAGRRSGLD